MWIELNESTLNDWGFGISRSSGQDEHGEIEMFSIELLLFSINFIWNSK
jgi:hypothetical protein